MSSNSPDPVPGHPENRGPRDLMLKEIITPKSDRTVTRRWPARGQLLTHNQVDKYSNFKAGHVLCSQKMGDAIARGGTDAGKGPCEEVTCERDGDLKESENRRREPSGQREQHEQRPWGWEGAYLVGGTEASVGAAVSSQARRAHCLSGSPARSPTHWY